VHPDLERVIELQEADRKIADLASQIEAIPSQIKKSAAISKVKSR